MNKPLWQPSQKLKQESILHDFCKFINFKSSDSFKELWQWSVKDQLQEYRNSLTESTKMLDSVIAVRDSEFEFIWWVLNPKD